MKKVTHLLVLASMAFMPTHSLFAGDENTREATEVLRAMNDEMARNRERLHLEDLADPFFIRYRLFYEMRTTIKATLGALSASHEKRSSLHDVRVLVGDEQLTNENFVNMQFMPFFNRDARLPREVDYDAIRRCLWLATDQAYKQAAEVHKKKLGALQRQPSDADASPTADFHATEPVIVFEPAAVTSLDRAGWNRACRELSATFRAFPMIQDSGADFSFIRGNHYMVNSEDTAIVQPTSMVVLVVWCQTQAEDGAEIGDHLMFAAIGPDGLPPLEGMKREVVALAQRITAMAAAPTLAETYNGPVLFEGQAVSAMLAQRFFVAQGALLNFKTPVYENASAARFSDRYSCKPMDDWIGRRILSRDLGLRAKPAMKEFEGTRLLGHFSVDAEGVKPPDAVQLIEKGKLLTLLSNRTPTKAIPQSNGHERLLYNAMGWSVLGPGVIEMESNAGLSEEEVRAEFRQLVADEGLPFGIVVRRLLPSYRPSGLPFRPRADGSSLTAPTEIVRIFPDGREELLRSVSLGQISTSALRNIVAASSEQSLTNTLIAPRYGGRSFRGIGGVPTSFIVPKALVFEELEVTKQERRFKLRQPVVPSPLQATK